MRANFVMDHSEATFRKEKKAKKIINVCLRMNIKLNLEETRREEDKAEKRNDSVPLWHDELQAKFNDSRNIGSVTEEDYQD